MRLLETLRSRARRALEAPAPEPVDYDRIAAIVRTVAEEVYHRRWSMAHQLRSASAADSARFVLQHIPLHLAKSHYELRRDAVNAAPADGLFLEFGVWQGSWLRQMAALREERFFGFDSFEGLPEPWSVYGAGTFDLSGSLPDMPANVELVKGWFQDTIPPFLAEHPEQVSFVHLDCDLYSSAKTVLDAIGDRCREGTQIVLDDFMLEPGWEREEHRAFFEFIESGRWRFEYTGYAYESPGCSAGVRLLGRD
ncbi:MAG: class I SAM-dependent methyltransferase [Thermoleophilaceae bacterium]|nr:class I SAM-dependent methyltransferase [Thermoleophilaceae bacterium]